MRIDSAFSVYVAACLILYTGYHAIKTRKPSLIVWLLASVMLLLQGITGGWVWTWAFVAGIAATIVLQWREI